jgi:hypothetical protein
MLSAVDPLITRLLGRPLGRVSRPRHAVNAGGTTTFPAPPTVRPRPPGRVKGFAGPHQRPLGSGSQTANGGLACDVESGRLLQPAGLAAAGTLAPSWRAWFEAAVE